MSMLEQHCERMTKVREELPCYGCSTVHPYGTPCADGGGYNGFQPCPLPFVPSLPERTAPTATAKPQAIKMPAPATPPSFQESRAHLDREIKRFEVAAELEALRRMRDHLDREIRRLEMGA